MKLSTFLLFDRDVPGAIDPIERSLAICLAADELGFESVWVAEHHFGPRSGMPNPAVFLACVAARTTTVRLGPAVAVLPLRNPLVTAEDYALVDRLSNGRLVMGVGSGLAEREFVGFGVDPGDKQLLFDEALAVLRDSWRDEAGAAGRAAINVRPVQRPMPPIYVASNRTDVAHRIGRQGLGLLTLASPTLDSLDAIGLRISEHRRGIEEAGHDPDRVRNAVAIMASIADSPGAAREQAVDHLSAFAREYGVPVEQGITLYDAMARRGTAAFGTPSDFAALVERSSAMGVHELILWSCFADMPAEIAIRTMRHAARYLD